MSNLSLEIAPLPAGTGWTATWSRDAKVVGEPFTVDGERAAATAAIGREFDAIFESRTQKHRPLVIPEALRILGDRLVQDWFAPRWADVEPNLEKPGPHHLVIRSGDPVILGLPWELIELSPGLPLGCDASWGLRRMPAGAAEAGHGPLSPGPLRILFLAAAPRDQPSLFYEREEEAILDATAHLPGQAVLHFAETGRFDELDELVPQCRPHILHLSGHGAVDAAGKGYFDFEDQHGSSDSRGAEELVSCILRWGSVRCVFLNACATSGTSAAGLCGSLVSAGLPVVIGWSGPVADDRATEFSRELYRRIVSGDPVAMAAAYARDVVRRIGQSPEGANPLQDATFAMAQVYGAEAQAALFDHSASVEKYEGPRSEPFFLDDGIVGLKTGFIGRRRECQRLLPALRAGKITFVVIQGLGGVGQSTLATRAANWLSGLGFRVVAVRTPRGNSPALCGAALLSKLRAALGRAFQQEKRDDLYASLTSAKIAPADQLGHAIDGMNDLELALVIDNLEKAVELETRRIADSELASFYTDLATKLTRGSRILVTSHYLPVETPTSRPTVLHLSLPDLSEADFDKFLRWDKGVEARIQHGELLAPRELYRALGGTPGFLDQVRTLLRTADIETLIAELEGGEPGALGEARETYLQRVQITRLYKALPSASRAVVCRVAVSELPLSQDAIDSLVGDHSENVERGLEEGVSLGLLQRLEEAPLPPLYQVPGLLRRWLLAPERLSEEDARAAHQKLAAFWRSSYETDREQELRVPIEEELTCCQLHASRGEAGATFTWATVQLGRLKGQQGNLSAAESLLEQVPEHDRDWEYCVTLAQMLERLGKFERAREVLSRFQGQASDQAVASLLSLASIEVRQGNTDSARVNVENALATSRTIRFSHGEACSLVVLAELEKLHGRFALARQNLEQALRISRSMKEVDLEKTCLKRVEQLETEQTISPLSNDTIRFLESTGVALSTLQTLTSGASNENEAHMDRDTRQKAEDALERSENTGEPGGEAQALYDIAAIDQAAGNLAEAQKHAQDALEIFRRIGDRKNELSTLFKLAVIELERENYDEGRQTAEHALRIAQETGNRLFEADCFHALAAFAKKRGRSHAALRLLATAWLIGQVLGERQRSSGRMWQLIKQGATIGYDVTAIQLVVAEAGKAYRRDRGWGMIGQSFAERGARDLSGKYHRRPRMGLFARVLDLLRGRGWYRNS
jgi:tetratricopeptide (TPR) repeat protein